MNTFWLKIAGGVVGIVIIVVVIGMFTSNRRPPQPKQPEKTFYDQAREDKEKFMAKPQPVETPEQQQTPEQNQNTEDKAQAQAQNMVAPAQQPAPKPTAAPPQPKILYFKPLSENDQIEAERLFSPAVTGRSIGRLPMTGFNLMVPNCRQIIKKWPDSFYAYRAKQLLADMPERFWQRYKITKEERDLSMFYKQRPGTRPYTEKELPK